MLFFEKLSDGSGILLGLTSDSSNFIPSIYKYVIGSIFILYGILSKFNRKGNGTNR